jgi:hypothetical protein
MTSFWLSRIQEDDLSADAKQLAACIENNFTALSSDYSSFRDYELAKALGRSVDEIKAAKAELIDAAHLIPLGFRTDRPSYKRSTARW